MEVVGLVVGVGVVVVVVGVVIVVDVVVVVGEVVVMVWILKSLPVSSAFSHTSLSAETRSN